MAVTLLGPHGFAATDSLVDKDDELHGLQLQLHKYRGVAKIGMLLHGDRSLFTIEEAHHTMAIRERIIDQNAVTMPLRGRSIVSHQDLLVREKP